jgi:hypothetical protein
MACISSSVYCGAPAGGAHLDQVNAELHVLAHFLAGGPRSVGHAFGFVMEFAGQQVLVAMPAGDAQRGTGNQQTRTFQAAGIDAVADRHVAEVGRADVAHAGEARQERAPRIDHSQHGFLGNGYSQAAVAGELRIEGQVRVHVDKAGQARGAVQIHHGDARRHRRGGGRAYGGDDAGIVEHHQLVAKGAAGGHVQQAATTHRARRGVGQRGTDEHNER